MMCNTTTTTTTLQDMMVQLLNLNYYINVLRNEFSSLYANASTEHDSNVEE